MSPCRWGLGLLLLLAPGGLPTAPAGPPPAARVALPDSLKTWLDARGGDSLSVQLAVADLTDHSGALLYGRAAELRQTPASLVKLLTASSALELWGPRHRLTTRAGYDPARITDDRRSGLRRAEALWIQGAGDPTLGRADLVALFRQVWEEGVDRVEALLIRPDAFDPLRLGPGWMWDDAGGAYAARPSQLTVQGNCLWAQPGAPGWELPGAALLRVETEPLARGMPARLERDWPRAGDRFTFMVPLLPADPAGRRGRWWVRPPEPACNVEWPDSLFRSVCFEAAQEVFGAAPRPQLDWSAVEPRGMAWFRHVGPPLVQVLDSVLTESWNLGAECTFQGLAAERPLKGRPGWERAAELCRQVLHDSLGMTDWFRQVDGSGMSRYNVVAPRQFVQVLAAMERRHPGLLVGLLPRPGEGTLATAAPRLPAGVELAAKTGTLRGVTGLAGYLGREGRPPRLAFCLLITGQGSGRAALQLRNEILARLAGWLAATS
jgi:D-alanyl-D-alanine carboxypeptidase